MEAGTQKFLGYRIETCFYMGNKQTCRQLTSFKGHMLPQDLFQFNEFPDGRNGTEKMHLFPCEEEEGGPASGLKKIIFFEETGTFLRQNLVQKQLTASHAEEIYNRVLSAMKRSPQGKLKSIAELKDEVANRAALQQAVVEDAAAEPA